ncbi:Methyltransferase type 11 [Niastella koreensis GR20-10]|uniref:Methyltransferase type 11 n=1 Tax=Niastella koreensis (strain DSM 17620 / KACC 11465 / NBRC 106392 / GR20-10) TaxID=700598 RepID=G8TNQ8_NIAKG|nr:class I SAM-dependent methyltransferase [Niastella koreensis]AEW00984.1 Methyltransferase type 11 [Niastella koreensis GR20-10]
MLQYVQRTRLRLQYRPYKGRGFTCNCCGKQYEKFAPRYPAAEDKQALDKHHVIAGYGEEELCPWCLSTSRERLVIGLLATQIPVAGKRILHLSPEPKVFAFLKQQQAVITSTDITPGFYQKIDKHIQYADATQLPFPDNAFDLVIGNHIMEHIPNDRLAMREIYRVLQPGGRAILQVPFSESISNTLEVPDINDPKQQSALFGQKDHVRIYALKDYLQRLRDAGFTVNYQLYGSFIAYFQYAIQPLEGFIHITK